MLKQTARFSKRVVVTLLLTGVIAAAIGWWRSDAMAAERTSGVSGVGTGADAGVAVVELFTSEGCSSCPPAEAVLGKLSEGAEKSGRPIFALAFHVDYWNRLGWTDPFSDAAYSERQASYSRIFGLESVYTPQMIVNGKTQFVGSDGKAAEDAVGAALAAKAAARVEVSMNTGKQGAKRIEYAVTGGEAGAIVNVAVVERGLSSKVARGENAGRTLSDANVVRWFKSGALAADGKGEVELPALDAVKAGQAMVVVYVQRAADLKVLGASRCDLR